MDLELISKIQRQLKQLYINISDSIKRVMIKDYLLFLKDKYTLTTLDTQCINNSVSCLRRMPDTPYINKKTGEPNGQKCIQITVDEMLELELDDNTILSNLLINIAL